MRSVDLRNFTYPAVCAGGAAELITVRNGEYSKETATDGYVERISFSILGIDLGDLTGDRREEAVVFSTCNTGGTGNFTEGYVYQMLDGRPALVARIPGGDRAYGGLHSVVIDRGLVAVDSYDPGENGANCCPQFIITTRYRLVGKRLVRVGTPTKREAFPTTRVTFDRGRSEKTLRVKLSSQDEARYVVRASKGQTLRATSDMEIVGLSVEGEDSAKIANGIKVRLSKSGDHTLYVSNPTNTAITFNVTIRVD